MKSKIKKSTNVIPNIGIESQILNPKNEENHKMLEKIKKMRNPNPKIFAKKKKYNPKRMLIEKKCW